MVELAGVSLWYPRVRGEPTAALSRVNARFAEGSFSAIIGPSGCGKTSLIKIMAGLVTASEGTVLAGEKPVRAVRRGTAVIFQDYGLLPWKTVQANAELPLRIAGCLRAKRQMAASLLVEFGLASFARHYPPELSGGMKQRLAIVRALTAEPELLLMDEPFSSLDAFTREDAQDFFLALRRQRRLTVIMVTHSIEEAVYLADAVYVMTGKNPGTISARFSIDREAAPARFRESVRFQEHCAAVRASLRRAV